MSEGYWRMYENIRVGVLGCAKIAERFLIPAFQSSNEFDLIGIASRNQNTANKFAEKFLIKSFESYDSMLASNCIDAVYIPLPNSLHYEWIRKSLEMNLHVLVEKSMACSYDDVLELTELAQQKKLVLLENFQFRFHSQLAYIKSLVSNGKIGEIRNIRSSFGFPPFPNLENIRYKKNLGGGALLDAGAYPLKIAQMFMSNNIYIASSNLFLDKAHGVDTFGSFQINDSESNITAQCAFGFDNFYQCNIELWGSKGKVSANRIFTSPPGYAPTISIQSADRDLSFAVAPDDHFKNMLLHFHNLITSGNGLEDEHKQNLRQAYLLQQIRDENR